MALGGMEMSTAANVWLVRAALEEAAGDKADELLNRRCRELAGRTPLEVAQEPGGANLVLAELDRIVTEEAGASPPTGFDRDER